MNYKNLITIVTIICLSLTLYVTFVQMNEYKSRSERMSKNLTELQKENSTIKFERGELKDYLNELNTKHKVEIDSILNANGIKVKNLVYLNRVITNHKDTIRDTVTFKEPLVINDSIYRKSFKVSRKCLDIIGFIETKDTATSIVIEETNYQNNIDIIKYYKKSFWDKVFFRKGKEELKVNSGCGEVNYNLIEINK